ncbi:acetate kinase [Eubacteriales bacterium OttesenSCG-928-K08]|nr:acetate kinase [Eubacteriales bacterium OttesenSCG-928-K08]
MIVMVINSGSSSLKYQLFEMNGGKVLAKGLCERIGIDGLLTHQPAGKDKIVTKLDMPSHQKAIEAAMSALISKEHGVLKSLNEISAVGHRIGHGGIYFSDSVRIDDSVKDAIRRVIPLAPLHNPAAIMGIEACEAVLGKEIAQVAVCDTAFHQSIPKKAYSYSLPLDLCEKHNIRRYGFHGTSHKYVAQQAASFIGRPYESLNFITCHLGNGSSIAAIEKGKSIDNTMGMTALEGLVMGTRCGDIDPGAISSLLREEQISVERLDEILYKESGLLGLSGISPDVRDIELAAKQGNTNAQNALDVLCYQIRKYIGAYMAALGGADAVVFTAGIGENSALVRANALRGLNRLGIEFDEERNNNCKGGPALISTDTSPTLVLVIPTNEEWVIANDALRLSGQKLQ